MKWTTHNARGDKETTEAPIGRWALGCLLGLIIIIGVCVGGAAGCQAYNRYQKRAEATNQVSITATQIKVAQQQAKVTRAQNAHVTALAQQRFIESVGIRRAQDEISKTLTPYYLQHEAIQAMQAIATSGRNNTAIYIPSGPNGVPVITQTPPKG